VNHLIVFVVYSSYTSINYANQCEDAHTTIEEVFATARDVETWAKEKKLDLRWSNGRGEAGEYLIVQKTVKTYTTNY